MTIKEELFHVMGRIAGNLASKSVTVIICSEASTTAILSMVGYRNSNGYGKVCI